LIIKVVCVLFHYIHIYTYIYIYIYMIHIYIYIYIYITCTLESAACSCFSRLVRFSKTQAPRIDTTFFLMNIPFSFVLDKQTNPCCRIGFTNRDTNRHTRTKTAVHAHTHLTRGSASASVYISLSALNALAACVRAYVCVHQNARSLLLFNVYARTHTYARRTRSEIFPVQLWQLG